MQASLMSLAQRPSPLLRHCVSPVLLIWMGLDLPEGHLTPMHVVGVLV